MQLIFKKPPFGPFAIFSWIDQLLRLVPSISQCQILRRLSLLSRRLSRRVSPTPPGTVLYSTWPGNSPDLNPIENCWNWMKDQLQEKKVTSVKNLIEIKRLWCLATPQDYLRTLSESMPRRLQAVIDTGGEMTKYWIPRLTDRSRVFLASWSCCCCWCKEICFFFVWKCLFGYYTLLGHFWATLYICMCLKTAIKLEKFAKI